MSPYPQRAPLHTLWVTERTDQPLCSATGNAIGEQVTSLTGKLSGCTRPESTSALHAGSAQHLDLAAQPWRL